MDVFALIMGLTLVCVGWFLSGDFRRFLAGFYSIPARIVSVTQAYRSSGDYNISSRPDAAVVYGAFYPVCEYQEGDQQIRFTAIGQNVGNLYQVGDQLDLIISHNRKARSRICYGARVLLGVLLAAGSLLLISPALGLFKLTLGHVCLASVVLTLALGVFLMYVRERDECESRSNVVQPSNKYVFSLYEPTAFVHWRNLWQSAAQKRRMLGVQICGSLLISAGLLIALAASVADRWESIRVMKLAQPPLVTSGVFAHV